MKKYLKIALGERIRELRNKDGLTLKELASKSSMHYNYLGDVERGTRNPSLENLERIAQGLDVHISALFSNLNYAHYHKK